jgi:hypothetical protein
MVHDEGTAAGRDHEAREIGEQDAPVDMGTSHSRDEGGSDDAPGQDRNSTTGTTPNQTPVGRVSGDETADTGQSGGERRVGRSQDAHEGALRDE